MTDSGIPSWFVFDEHGCFDTAATLRGLPQPLDRTGAFFSEVPDWYEVRVEDIRATWFGIRSLSDEEKAKLSPSQLEDMKTAAEGLLMLGEMTLKEDWTEDQAAVLRCLCFWKSLQLMDEIPGVLAEHAGV